MLVVEGTVTHGQALLQVRKTRGFLDVAAHLYDSLLDRHDADLCIIDPPRWTYRIGGPYPFSLGGLLGRLGQDTYRRLNAMPVVYEASVEPTDLKALDWSVDDIVEALCEE